MNKPKLTAKPDDLFSAIGRLPDQQITAVATMAGSDKRKHHWKAYVKDGSLTDKKAFIVALKEELSTNIRKVEKVYNACLSGKLKMPNDTSAFDPANLSVCGIIDLIYKNRLPQFIKTMDTHHKKEQMPFVLEDRNAPAQMTWWREKLLYTAIGLGRAQYAIAMARDYGADITHESEETYTPFLYAAQNGMVSFLDFCLKHGTDINRATPDGITALMLASFQNHPNTVKFLLDNGIDATRKTSKGLTALDLAQTNIKSSRTAKTVKYLEKGLLHHG